MGFVKCPHCGINLVVYENDYMPGCREMEDVYCPNCDCIADRVFTSGIPSARIDQIVGR